jgi:hypothetical protein
MEVHATRCVCMHVCVYVRMCGVQRRDAGQEGLEGEEWGACNQVCMRFGVRL